MRPRHLFVYGTLRPDGDAFEPLLAPVAVDVTDAVLEDHALYGVGLPYPFVVSEPGGRVVGALVEIDAGAVDATIERLDDYEGDAYRRVEVDVSVEDASVASHLYVAASYVRLSDDQRIVSGDWMRR